MINPLALNTNGYLSASGNPPISLNTQGHLFPGGIVPPQPPQQPTRTNNVQGRARDDEKSAKLALELRKRKLREDEEILLIIKCFVRCQD